MAAEVISCWLPSSAAQHTLADCRLLLVFAARHGSGEVAGEVAHLAIAGLWRLPTCSDEERTRSRHEASAHNPETQRHMPVLLVLDHRTNQRCRRCLSTYSMPGWLCVIITLFLINRTMPCGCFHLPHAQLAHREPKSKVDTGFVCGRVVSSASQRSHKSTSQGTA